MQPGDFFRRWNLPSVAFGYLGNHVVEVQIHEDRRGLFIRTKDAENFYPLLNRILAEGGFQVEAVAPADEDVHAVYQYLIGEGDNS